jgi:YidC/Oxa1 family membrane protein insertase
MQNDSNKNTLMFLVCAFAILIGYQFFVMGPQQKQREAELRAKKIAEAQIAAQPGMTIGADGVAPAAERCRATPPRPRARASPSTPRPCRARSP